MSNEQTVNDVYAAFQRGDVAAIVAHVADDARKATPTERKGYIERWRR